MSRDLDGNAVHSMSTRRILRRYKYVFRRTSELRVHKTRGQTMWRWTLIDAILFSAILFCFYRKSNSVIDTGTNWTYVTESDMFCNVNKSIKYAINEKFLIANKQFCLTHNPYLLIIVPSRVSKTSVRQAIRETYGSISRDKVPEIGSRRVDVVIRTLFVVGTSANETIQENIICEHRKYMDILQVNIIDSYYNLTAKMLHALKWINSNCHQPTYILKADEDVFVNVGVLLEQLGIFPKSENGNVFGKIFNTEKHLVVMREGKWSVSREKYPLEKYPPYAQGTSYTLTRNLIPKIIHTAQYCPYLHIEDVLITGIIAGSIHKADLKGLNKTSNWADPVPNPCKFAKDDRLSQHKMTSHLKRQTWKALTSFTVTCQTYRGRQILR